MDCSENVVAGDIPADMEELVAEKRRELIETVSEVDDVLAEKFLNDEPVTAAELEVLFFFSYGVCYLTFWHCVHIIGDDSKSNTHRMNRRKIVPGLLIDIVGKLMVVS